MSHLACHNLDECADHVRDYSVFSVICAKVRANLPEGIYSAIELNPLGWYLES